MASQENDWIEWTGGPCPVRGRVVDLKLRNGEVEPSEIADEWCGDFYRDQPCTEHNDNWMHDGSPFDIVAYRLPVSA